VSLRAYYYNKQLKKFITAFANVFTGLEVRTGKGKDGSVSTIQVPIVYGSRDRVVQAIASSHTQNKLYTLPMMACYLQAIIIDPTRLHGVNQMDRRRYLPQGGVIPDDIKALVRVMPIPYTMQMELSVHASNTDQLFQMMEQILILFDYDMQVEFNDAGPDWARITKLVLTSINNEEVYPAGTEKRALVWSLTFDLPVWLSPPAEIRTNIINDIKIRFGNIDGFELNEIDADGNPAPFNEIFTSIDIASDDVLP